MNSKLAITEKLLAELPESQRPHLYQAMHSWWMNFRDGGGMRLTTAGFEVFNASNFETYAFDASPALVTKPRHLLTLDKKLDCPYYIKIGNTPRIVLFGSQQAMMLAMYGDLEKWIDFLTRT